MIAASAARSSGCVKPKYGWPANSPGLYPSMRSKDGFAATTHSVSRSTARNGMLADSKNVR